MAGTETIGPARWRALTALVALERRRSTRLHDALRVDDLAARDRGLALELAFGVERRRITLDAILIALATRGELPADPYARTALRLGAYQVLYLPRMQVHAAVDTAVGLVRQQRSFVNAMLRRLVRQVVQRPADPAQPRRELELPPSNESPRAVVFATDALPDPVAAASDYLAVVYGLPSELVARWYSNHGPERARALAAASASTPGVTLRVNRLRADADRVRTVLAAEGVSVQATTDPRLLQLVAVDGVSPFATKAYRDGLFSVQDPTALAAADAVAAVPGETIFDLCAAPGGKACALAEILAAPPTAPATAAGGRVLAYDHDATRLARVRETRARLGLDPTLQVIEDLTQAPDSCDAVLVDVPCSNTGVLARRVEARRRPVAAALGSLVPEQVALLLQAIARTRPAGRVVYSTCSLEPEENRGVVDAALAAAPHASLEREQMTWPQAGKCDGGYFAVLRLGVPADTR